MKIGPIAAPSLIATNPLKPLTIKTTHQRHTVLFGGTFPLPQQSDIVEYEIQLALQGLNPAASRALIAQLMELASNTEWQRSGIYLTMREDLQDAQDGWYGLGSVEIPEEDPSQVGWATATLDILLRGRKSAAAGTNVDAKDQPNDFNLTGTVLGVAPQGLSDIYPAVTWTLTASDGSTISLIEGPGATIRGVFSSPTNMMTQGRCAVYDATTTPTGNDIEVFHPDHLQQNRYWRVTNGLVSYTIDTTTPGSPEVDVYTGAAWNKVGNFQVQCYSGAAYTVLPVQAVNDLVISPEEIIWEEIRYDNAGTGFARLTCRIRRGSNMIEVQAVSASGQGLIGPNSIALTNVPASVTGVATIPDTSGIVGKGSNAVTPGFLFLNAPSSTPAFSSTNLNSGLQVPVGTVSRFSILAGAPFGTIWTAMAAPSTPSAPTLARVSSTVNGLLTVNQYGLETNTTGWAVNGNCTIAQSAAQAFEGTKSLAVTASSAALMSIVTPTGVAGFAVTAGLSYSASLQARANTTGRTVQLELVWYNSGGAQISGSGVGTATDTNAGWTNVHIDAQLAPVGAVTGAVFVQWATPANAEVHYIDAISVFGAFTYTYEVVASNAYGTDSTVSATTTIITGPGTLTSSNYITITFPALPAGATSWKVIRTASGGTPSSTGIIGTGLTGAAFNDTGFAATAYAAVVQEAAYTQKYSKYNMKRVRERILIT